MTSEAKQSICGYSESLMQQVDTLRMWINTQVEFRGRSDDEFLAMYLHGCKYDLEKAKKKMVRYYENRKKIPQWFTNRDVNNPDLQAILQLKMTTLLIDGEPHHPLVTITKMSRGGQLDGNFDDHVKTSLLIIDIGVRRRNHQLNGAIWLLDFTDYSLWILNKFLSPIVVYNWLNCLYYSMPMKLKGVHVLNTPFMVSVIWTLMKPLIPRKLKKRVHFYGSDWSQLHDRLPKELLPEEYGGLAGPLSLHEEAHLKEIYSFNEYFKDDSKYGFIISEK